MEREARLWLQASDGERDQTVVTVIERETILWLQTRDRDRDQTVVTD